MRSGDITGVTGGTGVDLVLHRNTLPLHLSLGKMVDLLKKRDSIA